MKPTDLAEMSYKHLRTLRNNINNRLASFKQAGDNTKPLQKSHALFGLTAGQCQELLLQAQQEMKRRSRE